MEPANRNVITLLAKDTMITQKQWVVYIPSWRNIAIPIELVTGQYHSPDSILYKTEETLTAEKETFNVTAMDSGTNAYQLIAQRLSEKMGHQQEMSYAVRI